MERKKGVKQLVVQVYLDSTFILTSIMYPPLWEHGSFLLKCLVFFSLSQLRFPTSCCYNKGSPQRLLKLNKISTKIMTQETPTLLNVSTLMSDMDKKT